MAEGARLESVYTRKCIEGSNPSLTAKFKEKAWIRIQAFFCMVHRQERREASTGFDKTPAFWTANGGPQGERSESSPLSPPNSKRKPGFASRLFFAWCTAKRGEKPRQGSTKRLRFGPPTAARRVSAANQALSHRQIQRESLDSRPGFFLHGALRISPPSATVIPISAGYPRALLLIFSPFHDFCPTVRRSFQQSAHGLSGRTKTQKLFLTGSAPLPIVAPRCSDDFATKNMVRCPSG